MRCRRERGAVTASPPLTLRDTRVFETSGKRGQGIATMGGPIVQWRRGPDSLLVLPFVPVIPQTIQTAFAAVGINPDPIEHSAGGVDGILFMMGRNNFRLDRKVSTRDIPVCSS